MPFFFESFPTINYDLKKNNKLEVLTNVTVRAKLHDSLFNRTNIFYDYDVKDGERPDVVAYKYYGDASLDWVILLSNNIINPNYEWPLDTASFNRFLRKKYGSVDAARNQVHHYEKILRPQSVQFDGTVIEEKTVWVDLDTYNTLDPDNRKVIYSYDYENTLNEEKSRIKILDKRYITRVVNEIDAIFE